MAQKGIKNNINYPDEIDARDIHRTLIQYFIKEPLYSRIRDFIPLQSNPYTLWSHLITSKQPLKGAYLSDILKVTGPGIWSITKKLNQYLKDFSFDFNLLKTEQIIFEVPLKEGQGGKGFGYYLACYQTEKKQYLSVNEIKDILDKLFDRHPDQPSIERIGHFITKVHVPDFIETDHPQRIIIGEPPKLEHLFNGCFMYRDLFNTIYEKCVDWYEETVDVIQSGKVPVFWISGRQGDGKSVALLHLARELLTKNIIESILALSLPEELIDVFKKTEACFGNQGNLESLSVILIDRIYNPTTSHKFENALRTNLSTSFPAICILTTGTDADRDRFKGIAGDIFEVFDYSMPKLDRKEAQAFYNWSHKSEESLSISSFKFGDITLLEFMWEITHKDIKSFCFKLKTELEGYKIYEEALNVLAINTLGIAVPASIIPDEKLPLFTRFAKDENLFNINLNEDGSVHNIYPKSIRLGKMLFREATDPLISLEESLAQRIINALCILECQKNYKTYWDIVRCILDLKTLKDFFGSADILGVKKQIINRIYKAHITFNKGDCPPDLLGNWLELTYKYPWLRLPNKPVELALQLVNEQNKKLLTSSKITLYTWLLSESFEGDMADKVQVGLLHLFEEHNRDDCVYDMLEQILKNAQIEGVFGNKIKNWLQPNRFHIAAYKILCQLLILFPDDNEIQEWSLDWCQSNQKYSGVFVLLPEILKHNTDNTKVQELVFSICKNNICSPYIDRIISEIVNILDDNSNIPMLFMDDIISADPENPSIEKLLISFLKKLPESRVVLDTIEKRLRDYPRQIHSIDLAIAYVNAEPDSLSSKRLLVEWFDYNKSNLHCAFFLSAIAKQWKEDSRVSLLIESWIKANEDKPKIYKNLAHISRYLEDDPKVSNIILDWMSKNSSNYRAYNSIAVLVKARPNDNNIFNFSKDWLNNNYDHPKAYMVLSSMVIARPQNSDIKEEATKWLNNNLNNPLSAWLSIPLIETYQADQSVIKLVLNWLEKNVDYFGARDVLGSLIKTNTDESLFLGLLLNWLDKANEDDVCNMLKLYAESRKKYSVELFNFVKTWLHDYSGTIHALSLLESWVKSFSVNEEVKSLIINNIGQEENANILPSLLVTMVSAYPTDGEILSIAIDAVDNIGGSDEICRLLYKIACFHKNNPAVSNLVETWAQRNCKASNFHNFLMQIFKILPGNNKIKDIGLSWVCGNVNHPSRYHILALLIKYFPDSDDVINTCLDWINKYINDPSIFWLLNASIKAKAKDTRFISVAMSWMKKQTNHSNLYEVLGTIIKARPEDIAVFDIFHNWICSNWEHRQSFWVILTAVNVWFDNNKVVDLAKKWIANNPNHKSSQDILNILLNKTSRDQDIYQLARNWLSDRLIYTNVISTLVLFLAKYPGDSAALSLAQTFINNCEDSDRLISFAQKVRTILRQNSPIVSYFATWIENNPILVSDNPVLLARLIGLFPKENKLHKTTINWIESNYHVSDSYKIICALSNAGHVNDQVRRITLLWAENINDPATLIVGLSKIIPYMINYTDIYEFAENVVNKYPDHPDICLLIAAIIGTGKAGLNAYKMVEKHLSENPDCAFNTKLLDSMIKSWSGDSLVRDIAISWVSDNINYQKVHVVLSSMIKAWPDNAKIIDICQRWLDVNLDTIFAEKVITPLMKYCKDYLGIHEKAIKWVKKYPTYINASHIIAQLIITEPDNQQIYNFANTWIIHNFKSAQTRYLLRLILENRPDEENWFDLACLWQSNNWENSDYILLGNMLNATKRGSVLYEQFISRNHIKQRIAVLIVLIKAHKAKPYITDLALTVASHWKESEENKNHILRQLSQSLVYNLDKAVSYIKGEWPENRKLLVINAVCHGFIQVPARIRLVENHFFNELPSEYQVRFITSSIKKNIRSLEISNIISTWLCNHAKEKGYGTILKYLHLIDGYWSEIERLGVVSQDVIKNYERFEIDNHRNDELRTFSTRPTEEDIPKYPLSVLEWLEQNRTDEYWTAVWQNLWRVSSSTNIAPILFKLGYNWLKDDSNHEHGAWQYIWEKLWDSEIDNKTRNEFKDMAISCLYPPRAHRSWAFIWNKIYEYKKSDELIKLGVEWLNLIPDIVRWEHPGAGLLLSTMISYDPSNQKIIKHGIEYLANARPSSESITKIVSTLFQTSSTINIIDEIHSLLEKLNITAQILVLQDNVGKAQKELTKIDEILKQLISIKPDHKEYRNIRSRCLLLRGIISLKQNKIEDAKDDFDNSFNITDNDYLKQIASKLCNGEKL